MPVPFFMLEDLDFNDPEQVEERAETIVRVQKAFRYAQRPNRFLYGSDWPLAPMTMYRDFIREAVPKEYHEQVFVENAQIVFGVGAMCK